MYSRNTNGRGGDRIRVPSNYRGNAFANNGEYRQYQAAPLQAVPLRTDTRTQTRTQTRPASGTPPRAVHISAPSRVYGGGDGRENEESGNRTEDYYEKEGIMKDTTYAVPDDGLIQSGGEYEGVINSAENNFPDGESDGDSYAGTEGNTDGGGHTHDHENDGNPGEQQSAMTAKIHGKSDNAKKPHEGSLLGGLLGGLFGRDGKSAVNFEEIIMIGLILFMMQSDKDEDILILLALLLLCG